MPTEARKRRPRLGMMAWYASEGGRKCMWCGKYRKSADLLDCASGPLVNGEREVVGHIDFPPMCKQCREGK